MNHMEKTVNPEGGIAAAQVRPGAVVHKFQSASSVVVSGFHARLAHCTGPTEHPVVIGMRHNGKLTPEEIHFPVYGKPLNEYTRTNGRTNPPLDVAQEYHVALEKPVVFSPGDSLALEVVSSGRMESGIIAGVQIQGILPLAEMRDPFRQTKQAGPVCRIAWSEPETVCTGSEIKYDPKCSPQNNSGVVSDPDGTFYQFTSFYSVDEQHTERGREGSYARIFPFKKPPQSNEWEPCEIPFDLPAGIAYLGDPFAFRDLMDRPCLLYSMGDGTRGFADWEHIWGCLRVSKTDSFAGPWDEPHFFIDRLPGEQHNQRCIGLRVYPRKETGDYVLLWQMGEADITVRGVILENLDAKLSHNDVLNAPVLVRNQEEGGGGFVHGGKGYLSTWQIPSINDPTSIQRLYEFDLDSPLSPENWRVVPGSAGFNDGANPDEDGGETADSWSLSLVGNELFATSVAWSVSHRRNSILVRHVPWDRREGNVFRYGVSKVPGYQEVAPVVEYALGPCCALEALVRGYGPRAHLFVGLAPANSPLLHGGIALEISDSGARLTGFSETGAPYGLTAYCLPEFVPGRDYKIELVRHGSAVTGKVDGRLVGTVCIGEPLSTSPLRFKFYGWQGNSYEIREAVLTDGDMERERVRTDEKS